MAFSLGKSWALAPWEGQILHGGQAPCMASAGLLRKHFVRALNLGPIADRSCVSHLLKSATRAAARARGPHRALMVPRRLC